MRGNFLLGLLVGAAAARFGPELWRNGRPLAKAGLKAGVEGYIVARRATIRFAEEVEDLIAEVATEFEEAAAISSESDGDVIRAGGDADAA
jgi:hypothetical protein